MRGKQESSKLAGINDRGALHVGGSKKRRASTARQKFGVQNHRISGLSAGDFSEEIH